MFCPKCGTTQSDDLKFCKSCGANLSAVRQAVATRETPQTFDWSKTWLTEMFLSEGERKLRQEELERQLGITPEVRRQREIKAGVITSCVGLAVAIFLKVFMEGIILGAHIPADVAEILGRLWIVGIIPFFVGLGLLINGLFVGRHRKGSIRTGSLLEGAGQQQIRAADTSEFLPPGASVTEQTTRQLEGFDQRRRDSNVASDR